MESNDENISTEENVDVTSNSNEPASNSNEPASNSNEPASNSNEPAEVRSAANHVYVGKKPVMSYAMSGLIQLGHYGEIVIKGRGKVISYAVDVSQIIIERLGEGKYEVKKITIGTDVVGDENRKRNVSTIELVVGTK